MSRPSIIKSFIDSQELARRFNEDEAVWREYEYCAGYIADSG
jgi:hypothetical protein